MSTVTKINPFESYSTTLSQRCNTFLSKILNSCYDKQQNEDQIVRHATLQPTSSNLLEAIRYSIFNGGKRLRPLLVYATGETLDAPLELLDAAAASVELIHCYSLVHDDLPAMDDDDLRRGKPSCHKAFDEATAILTGDALQTLAFEILSSDEFNPVSNDIKVKMIQTLAKASGFNGMAFGQSLDVGKTGERLSTHIEPDMGKKILSLIHQKKTGALIEASVKLGFLAANCYQSKRILALEEYARNLGLSFQIQDDILDITAPTNLLGKTQGKDIHQNKMTFPSLLGLAGAKQYAEECHQQAVAALDKIFAPKEIQRLSEISEYFIQRIQ